MENKKKTNSKKKEYRNKLKTVRRGENAKLFILNYFYLRIKIVHFKLCRLGGFLLFRHIRKIKEFRITNSIQPLKQNCKTSKILTSEW